MADGAPEKPDHLNQGRPAEQTSKKQVRGTILLWIAGTLVLACVAATFLEFKSRSAHMAMSNLPLAVLLLFIFWLLGNTLLKRACPRFSLTTAELRVMLCVLWVGASFAGYNWVTQWVGALASPQYFASPENRWQELIFDYLPWWMYPANFPGVVDKFYLGLGKDEALPWGAWAGPIFWAGSAALAMTAIGLGLTAIFQKQWAEHERLTFPLSEVSLELTEGFDRRPGWAPFVCNRLFWVGFAIAAFPLLWNIVEYWVPDFPRLTIFDPRNRGRTAPISRYLPWPFSYRLLPTLIGFTFLCDLNILFSLWSLKVVGQAAFYVMNRVGFSIGRSGQEADPMQIAVIFEHGVMLGLGLWAVWTTRPHLKQVAGQILRPVAGQPSVTSIFSARGSAAVLLGGVIYMVFWLHAAGYSFLMAAVWLGLFWTSIFVAMKYLAASGFAYLWPHWSEPIPKMWVGTGRMSESTLVASKLIGWRVLSGWRLPPALPHVVRLIGGGRQTRWLVPGSVVVGLLSASLYTIWLCYDEGGGTFRTWSLVGAPRGLYNTIASLIAETHPTVPDPAKIAVWIAGGLAATIVTALQAQFPWWPIHPLGLMLMFNWYVNLYMLDIFLVWLTKLLVLKLGGIGMYRQVKPVAYGLIVGYVFAVGCAFMVDLIWFPGGGHYIHGY